MKYLKNIGKNANQLNCKWRIQACQPLKIIFFTQLQKPCLKDNYRCQVYEITQFMVLLEAGGEFKNNTLWQCSYVKLYSREVFSVEWRTWPVKKAAGIKTTSTDSLVYTQWEHKNEDPIQV